MRGQNWFMNKMGAMGYTFNEKGVCKGIAEMSRHAYLTEGKKGLKSFNQRLIDISNLDINYFETFNDKEICSEQDNDIRAFFDGVVLFSEPDQHRDFLPTDELGYTSDQSHFSK